MPRRQRRKPRVRGQQESFPRPGNGDEEVVAWKELESNFLWYDTHAWTAWTWYVRLKAVTLVAGALVPVFALVDWQVCAALAGVLVVVSEGTSQLFSFHENWIRYRGTAESLRLEAIALTLGSRDYAGLDDEQRRQRLAERVADLLNLEQTQWVQFVQKDET